MPNPESILCKEIHLTKFMRCRVLSNPNEMTRLAIGAVLGVTLGFFLGTTFPSLNVLTKLCFPCNILSYVEDKATAFGTLAFLNQVSTHLILNSNSFKEIYAPSNPKGTERLPPEFIQPESDLYLRQLWGDPSEDPNCHQKYLVAFTVGLDQKNNIDAAVKKFSDNFTIVLFHYDRRTSDWDEFEWSKRVVHVSVEKQTKWWYAKRFLHPDIVSRYEYIFIWDEDLGLENFDAEEFVKVVRKHALEVSQPALDPNNGIFAWSITLRKNDSEVHKETKERPGWCSDPHLPPCAGFVEIMAPVFSRNAWRCVWHMIQNDLVHGWGLDLLLGKCVERAHEKIGVVDSQWIVHQGIPSLGNQGKALDGSTPLAGVRARSQAEWELFRARFAKAEEAYYRTMGVAPPNDTTV
ncbi:hypothetical protein HPP92_007992 [Vanilla planifolia]|uniref:Uncharacterized protein n=1 Tax=Vanilla planifolia TaxID=51239 RepID=A0A835RL88_VANPL|nr:hypothetical protein HPP92_007992 [Vanilla planifolia]